MFVSLNGFFVRMHWCFCLSELMSLCLSSCFCPSTMLAFFDAFVCLDWCFSLTTMKSVFRLVFCLFLCFFLSSLFMFFFVFSFYVLFVFSLVPLHCLCFSCSLHLSRLLCLISYRFSCLPWCFTNESYFIFYYFFICVFFIFFPIFIIIFFYY